MQTPITNSCGHVYAYRLYGPGKDRARKAAWLATVPCPACKYGRQQAAATPTARRVRCDCPSGQMGGACTCC
jgi:hypothetical protein